MNAVKPISPARHYIEGEWIDAGAHAESIDPATGEALGSWSPGSRELAEQAIAAARTAFDTTGWKTRL